jgi:hypothetical protein
MIERWKLRRELNRIREQIASVPAFLYEPLLQARYDRTRDLQIRISDGNIALCEKVALFLVFQPHSLADSVEETCSYLLSCGYSILLVANGGLSENSRKRLSAYVWRFLDRPNFGYDFGGYRDGIIKLDDWNISPERLLILNDSIWLPLHDESSPVLQAEEIGDAITGLLMHTRASREQLDGPEVDGMIESYFFSVPATILRQDGFRRFWRDLRLSNSKVRVIHRGERGFSKAMHALAIPLSALSSRRLFLSAVSQVSPQFLRSTLHYAAYVDADFQRRGDLLLETFRPTEDWRQEALAHVFSTVRRRRFNASFYWAADRLVLTNFMKKNKGELFVRMRRSYLLAVSEGELPTPSAAIMFEVHAMSPAHSKE